MRHPSTKALFSYWLRLKGQRIAPQRSEINPRDLAAHLGDIFLLDASETSHALRLAGSRMEAELGATLVGAPYASLFSDETRREALQALSLATLEGEPVILGVKLDRPRDDSPEALSRPDTGQWVRPHWPNQRPADLPERRASHNGSGELLLLPLVHRGVVGARVIGAFGLNMPSQHLPSMRLALAVTSERVLGTRAMAVKGPKIASGAMVVARNDVVSLFRGSHTFGPGDRPLYPQNDS